MAFSVGGSGGSMVGNAIQILFGRANDAPLGSALSRRWEREAALRAIRPDVNFHMIAGAGHWPQWEKPDEFHRAHLRFLNGGI